MSCSGTMQKGMNSACPSKSFLILRKKFLLREREHASDGKYLFLSGDGQRSVSAVRHTRSGFYVGLTMTLMDKAL